MKSKLLKIIVFILLNNISFSQPKDTIYGKIKSIREQLTFLEENHQNPKLFDSDGDYGHSGFSSAENTKNIFYDYWYNTYWVYYINYFKEFDIKNRLIKEIWYNKNQSVLTSTENTYNDLDKITNRKLHFNETNEIYTYDKNNNLIFIKSTGSDENYYSITSYEYTKENKILKSVYIYSMYPKEIRKTESFYDSKGNLFRIKNYDQNGEEYYGTKFEYDDKGRKIKIINHSPFIWVKSGKGEKQKRTKDGSDQISREFVYDDKDRIIQTNSYIPDFYDPNKVSLHGKEKKTYENDLLTYIYNINEKDSVYSYKKYEYDDKKRKIKETLTSPKSPDNKIMLEYFYSETEFPTKLIYTNEKTSVIVDFEYVFDDKNNWIEQTKIVNEEKLYVWKREIKYFE